MENLFLGQALLQALTAALEGLVDGLGGGREPPLEDREGEADVDPLLVVSVRTARRGSSRRYVIG